MFVIVNKLGYHVIMNLMTKIFKFKNLATEIQEKIRRLVGVKETLETERQKESDENN